ncbi:Uncharacterised protein [Nocardia africana]|uniref:Uncharacterized protein n=1 Tax=Nocardia africana TaxID=134964 RepID=A0A378WPM0_9NOCA|nr:Uncharacterised protein [Nocardia africana]
MRNGAVRASGTDGLRARTSDRKLRPATEVAAHIVDRIRQPISCPVGAASMAQVEVTFTPARSGPAGGIGVDNDRDGETVEVRW